MAEKQRALIDVDGTLTRGPGASPDSFAPLNTGARAFLGALKDRGYEIIIFSARSPVGLVRQHFQRQDLDRYVDGYTRTKLPSRIIVDDRAIQFRGDYAQTLKEIDGFRPHYETPAKYCFCCIQLPEELAAGVKAIGAKIKDEDLHEEGREADPHVTVYFGLTEDDPELLRHTVAKFGPVVSKVGLIGMFDPPKHDVLKLAIESPDLVRLHDLIRSKVPHIDTHKDYKPHCTIAYCQTGHGNDYLMLDNPLLGKEFTVKAMTFSDRNKRRRELPL